MKVYLVIGGWLIAGIASAQDTVFFRSPRIHNALPNAENNNSGKIPNGYIVNPEATLLLNAKKLHTLPNGNTVYALPQDNMPCVVPDMKQFSMPVEKPKLQYTIPNPALPPSPDRSGVLTEEQLKLLFGQQRKQLLEKQPKQP